MLGSCIPAVSGNKYSTSLSLLYNSVAAHSPAADHEVHESQHSPVKESHTLYTPNCYDDAREGFDFSQLSLYSRIVQKSTLPLQSLRYLAIPLRKRGLAVSRAHWLVFPHRVEPFCSALFFPMVAFLFLRYFWVLSFPLPVSAPVSPFSFSGAPPLKLE